MVERVHQLVVFGATGLTARVILSELVDGPPTRLPPGFSWGIAGRNRAALESLRTSLFRSAKSTVTVQHPIPLPVIIVADVHDEGSLAVMSRQTRLLLNCVGPYRDFGESVVRACIETNTDYLDLCGEPGFIERMHLVYHDAAVKAGVTIVHAAAFDSVPCDLGVLLCKKLLAQQNAYPSSVEMFFSLKVLKTFRNVMNYATYEAAIKGFSSRDALRDVRKEIGRVHPKPVPVGCPAYHDFVTDLLGRFGIIRDSRVGGKTIPIDLQSIGALDPAVVRLSQSLTLYLLKSASTPPAELAPVHFAAYIQLPSLRVLLVCMLYFTVFQFLVAREWGRKLLYKYPGVFTGGAVGKNVAPDDGSRDGISFTQTLYARGYSQALHPTPANAPDVNVVVRIAGPEPGYESTAIIFLEAAALMLRRRDAIPKGVLTPAVAFGPLERFKPTTSSGEGGVMDAMQRDGRVTWSVLKS